MPLKMTSTPYYLILKFNESETAGVQTFEVEINKSCTYINEAWYIKMSCTYLKSFIFELLICFTILLNMAMVCNLRLKQTLNHSV
jgi:hypothetical protein